MPPMASTKTTDYRFSHVFFFYFSALYLVQQAKVLLSAAIVRAPET